MLNLLYMTNFEFFLSKSTTSSADSQTISVILRKVCRMRIYAQSNLQMFGIEIHKK